jgi:hypothetical protein
VLGEEIGVGRNGSRRGQTRRLVRLPRSNQISGHSRSSGQPGATLGSYMPLVVKAMVGSSRGGLWTKWPRVRRRRIWSQGRPALSARPSSTSYRKKKKGKNNNNEKKNAQPDFAHSCVQGGPAVSALGLRSIDRAIEPDRPLSVDLVRPRRQQQSPWDGNGGQATHVMGRP